MTADTVPHDDFISSAEADLEAFWQMLKSTALAAWHRAEAEGLALEQKLVPVLEDGLAKALRDFGALAGDLIMKFMQAEFAHLTGAEKHGNVVTYLVQTAEAQGKALAITDANSLVKNLFLTITGTAPG